MLKNEDTSQKELVSKLNKLNIKNSFDLLLHIPYRYENRTQLIPLNKVEIGKFCYFAAKITKTKFIVKKRKQFIVTVQDGAGTLDLIFYNFTSFHTSKLKEDTCLTCYGEVKFTKYSGRFIVHPEFNLITPFDYESRENLKEKGLTPVYNSTAGLYQKKLRAIIKNNIHSFKKSDLDFSDKKTLQYIPELIEHFPTISKAIEYIHEPCPKTIRNLYFTALQRIAYEELLAHHLSLKKIKKFNKTYSSPKFQTSGKLLDAFNKSIPFELTNAQKRVIQDIKQDLEKETPMVRLVQGDVGSGKTIVAAIASILAIQASYQVALMVPTELLAEQHFENFKQWFDAFNINTCLLSGKLTNKNKTALQKEIKLGNYQMVIGTHALFQENTRFHNLGFIIIDEQHRFGVNQRKMLRDKGVKGNTHPHQLILTATPIPRTLALTFHADLDCSVIDELPPNRQQIVTETISEESRDEVIQKSYADCKDGAQIYWVCPLITESEVLECQAAENIYETLKEAMPSIKIGLVHGKMKPIEKEAIMSQFIKNEISILVATTVIEVGVNVPNATVMVIENSERLGLAQLHQLRGRVGRGSQKSYCKLLHSHSASQLAKTRLNFLASTTDGFKIAEKDLEYRGPGEFLGTKQTGGINFKIADLARDKVLLSLIPKISSNIPKDTEDKLIELWVQSAKNFAKI